MSDFLINGVNTSGDLPFLAELFQIRIDKDRLNAQHWASLAFVNYQMGKTTEALAVLKEGGELIPTFERTANCIADNIQNGRDPQAACVE